MAAIVRIDPRVMGGTPCFAGTRVPFRTLLDHLLTADTLDTFLDDFPSVTREQAVAALKVGYERVLAEAESAEPAAR
jgi:uncharacterized protein (DUF433 family)